MTTSEHSTDFWDRETTQRGGARSSGDDFASFGTVTQAAATVKLRDRLEKAHFDRVVDLHPTHRVLDLGGGAGRFALWLASRVAEVTVVDASEALLRVGRAEAQRRGVHNVSFVHASALDFEPDQTFDRILVMGMATHLDDDDVAELVERCDRCLRAGGRLVMKEPVSTDETLRKDERWHPDGSLRYRAWFRPASFYREVVEGRFHRLYEAPTCAHPIPWFLGSTNEAAETTEGRWAAGLLAALTPLWVAADPVFALVENALRGRPVTRRLLADVPVLQELFVFGKPRAEPTRAPGDPVISVVMIAYDEEACLQDSVDELLRTLRRRPLPFEVVLVDDGSRDATAEIMVGLAEAHPEIRVQRLEPNRGIGGALKAGFDAARGAYVTWLPADGQIPPDVVWQLYDRRALGAVVTTVYRQRDDHWIRNVISSSLNTMIWLRTGRKAKSGGNYLMSRQTWLEHGPRGDDSMMLSTAFRANVRDAGEAIVEHEIDCRRRTAGYSKVLNPRAIGRTLRGLGLVRRK